MYYCRLCGDLVPAGIAARHVVLERRDVDHPPRYECYRNRASDPGGRGTQIVREVVACEACSARADTKTELGERLRARRQAIVEAGVPLLDEDGVEEEVRDRRGGVG